MKKRNNHYYLVLVSLIFVLSCSNTPPQEDVKNWTQFKTRIEHTSITYLTFALPPGAEIIKAPNSVLELNRQSEYSILTAGYPYFTKALHDIHLAVVLYRIAPRKSDDLVDLSESLSKDINIMSHNNDLSWHKNAGQIIQVNNVTWLHREGFSTGPNNDQKLDVKNEDAYLRKVTEDLALGIYVSYYEGIENNKSFARLIPKILENISIRRI